MDLHDSDQIMEEIERVRLYLNELEEARTKLEFIRTESEREQKNTDFIDIYNITPIEEQNEEIGNWEQEYDQEIPEIVDEELKFSEELPEVSGQTPDQSSDQTTVEVDELTAEEMRERNQLQLVQSILKRLGIYDGNVDGNNCKELDDAIALFKKQYALPENNRLDRATTERLDNYLYGYEMYLIRRGDTIQSIANRTGNTVRSLSLANPKMDTRFLRPGKRIVIPTWDDTVPTDTAYTYGLMKKNVYGFKTRFPFIDIGIIGKSVLGKNIYSIKLGNGPKSILLNATHHGLEWLNSVLLMKFVEAYLNAYIVSGKLGDLEASQIWSDFTIYVVPMVNPDGVDIVLNGIAENEAFYDFVQGANTTARPLSQVWNANAKGVDLNRNYDSRWQQGKLQEEKLGITGPGVTRFGGEYPVSEPETRAMVDFTNRNNFLTTVSYHSQGNTIFASGDIVEGTDVPEGTFPLLTALEEGTSYGVENVPEEMSYAGYKDWFVEKFNRPAFTIETGIGVNPLDISQFNEIYEDNLNGVLELLKVYMEE